MAFYLEPLHDGGRQIVLDKAVVLIGRQAECDVILQDSRKVSRKHCCIAQVNDTYVVRDLASMNGVRVNGERIDREAPLEIGDEISFGDVRYVLRDTRANPVAEANGSQYEADDSESIEAPEESQAHEPEPAPPASKPERAPAYRQPANISQKFPVPISDEDDEVDFAIEPSIQIDRAEIEAEANKPARDADPDAEDDVIMLDESREVRSDD